MQVGSINDGMGCEERRSWNQWDAMSLGACWVDATKKERRGLKREIGGWPSQEQRQNVARIATKKLGRKEIRRHNERRGWEEIGVQQRNASRGLAAGRGGRNE